MRRVVGLVVLGGCGFLDRDPPGQDFDAGDLGLSFEDVSDEAGITGRGASYGAGWGDVDADGDVDLWSGNHAGVKSLYLNRGDGTFEDVAEAWLPGAPEYDAHGVAIVDLDGDGRSEIVESVGAQGGGGVGANRVYHVDGGQLRDRAVELGLDYPEGSGRCPIVWDWNGDGRLDVLLNNQPRADGVAPTALFTQRGDGTFGLQAEVPASAEQPTALCGQLADLDGDKVPEVIRFGRPSHLAAHDSRSGTLRDVSRDVGLPPANRPFDVVVADLTGDLRNDVFITRWEETSAFVQDDDGRTIRVALRLFDRSEGLAFRTEGAVNVTLDPPWFWKADEVYAGAGCVPLLSLSPTLEPDDPRAQGLCPVVEGESRGLFLGLVDGVWSVRVATDVYDRGGMTVRADSPITDLDVDLSLPTAEDEAEYNRDRLWVRGEEGFVDEGWKRGFQQYTTCTSAAAADFDNDMDLDLFLVCATPVSNTEDLLYLNDGKGRFRLVGGHGAEGTREGRGDTVVVGDADADGFLDLFVTNGFAAPPFNDGPHRLFRNRGNANHWLQLVLVGTRGAREAVGSTVVVTAGGVSQLREANGGTHAFGQHERLIHVGLGPHAVAERVEITWPDGTTQVLTDVPADGRLEVEQE